MKRQLSVMLVLALVLQFIPIMNPVSFANQIQFLEIVPASEEQVIQAGELSPYEITFKNSSRNSLRNISFEVSGDHPFRADRGQLRGSIRNFTPNQSAKESLSLYTNPTTPEGLYAFQVTVNFEYYDINLSDWTKKVEQHTAYVRVKNNNIEPMITVLPSRFGHTEILENEKTAITFHLENKGTLEARNIRVQATGFSNDTVILDGMSRNKVVSEIGPGGSHMLYYSITSGPDMKAGTHPILLEVTYTDAFGKSYTEKSELYVIAKKADSLTEKIEIIDIKKPSQVDVAEDFEITFTVKNKGEGKVEHIEVELDVDSNFIMKSSTRHAIRSLGPGESQDISYRLMAKDGTTLNTYHNYINLKVSEKTERVYAGVFVSPKSESTASTRPKLIVDNYEYGGDYVLAGEEFTMVFYIKNTSNAEGTRNIKATMSSESNIFTPVGSSSSFYIPSIKAGEVYRHEVVLQTKMDASVKNYTLNIEMEYEDTHGNAYDKQNNPYKEQEALNIAVAQPVRLETDDLRYPTFVTQGQSFDIEQEFYNMGRSPMYNMMVRLEGLTSRDGSHFVGTFEAGRSNFFVAQVFAEEAGEIEAKLVYTFEDALGRETTLEKPFTIYVEEAQPMDQGNGFDEGDVWYPEDPFEEESNGGNLKKIMLVLGAIVVIGGLVGLKIRKNRRLKRELEELDD